MAFAYMERMLENPADPAAWDALLTCYNRRMRGMIYRHGGGQCADDILQNVWLRVYRAFVQGAVHGSIEPLLVTIVRNETRRALARVKELATPVAPDSFQTEVIFDGKDAAAARITMMDLNLFFKQYLQQADDQEQANRRILCFQLCVIYDISPARVAEKFVMPKNTIYTWLSRMRKDIHAWMRETSCDR